MNRHVWNQCTHAIDGIHHRGALKEGDPVLFLVPPNNCALLDSNLKALTTALFEQDFGMTAGTLMSVLPEPQRITNKVVGLVQFIDKWNKTCDVFQKQLKAASVPGANLTVNDAVAHLKSQVSPGDEPWVYNQFRSARNVATAINFNGVIGHVVTHGAIQHLDIAEHPVNCTFPATVYSKRSGSIGAGMSMYLFIVPCHTPNTTSFEQFCGTKMFLVASESSMTYVLSRMITDKVIGPRPIDGSTDVCVLRLGHVINSEVFTSSRGRWATVDINSARTPAATRGVVGVGGGGGGVVAAGTSARKRRAYTDMTVSIQGVKTTKLDYTAPLDV